jgi:hypothetical protein
VPGLVSEAVAPDRVRALCVPAPDAIIPPIPEFKVLREPRSRSLFGEIVARSDDAVDLAEASLLIACEAYPDLEVPAISPVWRRWPSRCANAWPARRTPPTHLGPQSVSVRRACFRGTPETTTIPQQLPERRLDRRREFRSPVGLYIEVGRRVGLDRRRRRPAGHIHREGGGSAGRHPRRSVPRGALLSQEDCQRRLDRIYEGRVQMEPSMLAPCGRKPMLARMLRTSRRSIRSSRTTARLGDHRATCLKDTAGSAEERPRPGPALRHLDC